MCWKSNLNEIDTEVIDDLGGKASNSAAKTFQNTSAPAITRQRPSSAKGAAASAKNHQTS